jgi:hypothetical protein
MACGQHGEVRAFRAAGGSFKTLYPRWTVGCVIAQHSPPRSPSCDDGGRKRLFCLLKVELLSFSGMLRFVDGGHGYTAPHPDRRAAVERLLEGSRPPWPPMVKPGALHRQNLTPEFREVPLTLLTLRLCATAIRPSCYEWLAGGGQNPARQWFRCPPSQV